MKWILIFALMLTSISLAPGLKLPRGWRIWNVGQGLWTTYSDSTRCFHFDAGGERKPVARIRTLCRGKENLLLLSHWDWDHIGGVASLKAALPNLCLLKDPGGKPKSPSRARAVRALPRCTNEINEFQILNWNRNEKKSNDASHVGIWKDRWIFPGDSPSSEERKWLHRIPAPEKIRLMIAGHHGSKTSTSRELLAKLPHLQLVIVSARKQVYGHPHPDVLRRLREFSVPSIRTEEWGHLLFEE